MGARGSPLLPASHSSVLNSLYRKRLYFFCVGMHFSLNGLVYRPTRAIALTRRKCWEDKKSPMKGESSAINTRPPAYLGSPGFSLTNWPNDSFRPWTNQRASWLTQLQGSSWEPIKVCDDWPNYRAPLWLVRIREQSLWLIMTVARFYLQRPGKTGLQVDSRSPILIQRKTFLSAFADETESFFFFAKIKP